MSTIFESPSDVDLETTGGDSAAAAAAAADDDDDDDDDGSFGEIALLILRFVAFLRNAGDCGRTDVGFVLLVLFDPCVM